MKFLIAVALLFSSVVAQAALTLEEQFDVGVIAIVADQQKELPKQVLPGVWWNALTYEAPARELTYRYQIEDAGVAWPTQAKFDELVNSLRIDATKRLCSSSDAGIQALLKHDITYVYVYSTLKFTSRFSVHQVVCNAPPAKRKVDV